MDTNTAINETLSKGLAAYQQQQYEEALILLLPIAEAGNPEAQFRVGEIYDEGGYGVTQDDEAAWAWLHKAALQGHLIALSTLLFLDKMAELNNSLHLPKLEGIDAEKETNKCIEELNLLAEKSDCEAILHLAMLLGFCAVSESNVRAAAAYALKGAQLEDPDCMVLLAMFLLFIDDLEGNQNSILEWHEKAYALGSRLACDQIGTSYYDGLGVKRDTKKAFRYFEEAAKKGSASAALSAGKCKAYGIGTNQCCTTAFNWIVFAANNGEREAQYFLASIEDTLPNISLPEKEKMKWLVEAARRGHPPAIRDLGLYLLYGYGVKKDVSRGIYYLRQAASQDDAEAQFRLGRIFELGEFVPHNHQFSIKCYSDAAKNGSPHGHVHYGLALLYGNGVKRDPDLAEYHFAAAFEQGEPNGAVGLGYCYAHRRDKVKALGYFNYALKYVSEQTAEDVGSYKDGLIDTMTDVELSEAEEFANQIGVRGTA